MTEAERKVRRAALVAGGNARFDSSTLLSDHIVDAVLDTLSALSDSDLADVLGRTAPIHIGPES